MSNNVKPTKNTMTDNQEQLAQPELTEGIENEVVTAVIDANVIAN